MNIFELIKSQMLLLIVLILTKKYHVFQLIILTNIIFLIVDDDDIYSNFIENIEILINCENLIICDNHSKNQLI